MGLNNQTIKETAYFPFDGYVVEAGADEGSLTTVGGCDGDATGDFAYTVFKYQNAGNQTIINQIKNMVMNLSFTLSELNTDSMETLAGGALTKITTAGTPVVGDTQVVASGNWSYDKLIELTGQNASGAQPTINSVTGSVDGALTVNDDYFVAKTKSGKWAIYIVAAGTLTTTEVQSITIDTDYTPAASVELHGGSAGTTLSANVIRFAQYDTDGTTILRSLTIWSSTLGEGGLSFIFGSALNDGVNTMPMTLIGDIDTNRADGKQLFKYFDSQSA
jgi:hypothetical protein